MASTPDALTGSGVLNQVGTLQAASNRIEAAVAGISAQIAELRDRTTKLECKADKPQKSSERWYNSNLISSVFSGIILGLFAFLLTGKFERSLQERQLSSANAKEMQQLLVTISKGEREEAEAAAISIATFGRDAVPPLVENLQYGGERSVAAERGLRALALSDAPSLCSRLSDMLRNRSQLYTAASHLVAVRVLGVAECAQAIPVLTDYANLIKRADTPQGLSEYQQAVQDATPSNVTTIRQELTKTLNLLHANYSF